MIIRHTGRSAARDAKTKGRGWCVFCDAALVRKGEPCPNCGKIDGPRRFKKPLKPFDLTGG